MVANLGRLDVLQSSGGLNRLIASLTQGARRLPIAGLRQSLELHHLRRVVIIADRGVVSEPLLEELELESMEYIAGMPLRKWQEVREVLLSRAGRYHEVKDNLRVKVVEVNGHRYKVKEARQAEIDRKKVEGEARYGRSICLEPTPLFQ